MGGPSGTIAQRSEYHSIRGSFRSGEGSAVSGIHGFDGEIQLTLKGIRGLICVFKKGSTVQIHSKNDPRFGGPD